MEFKDLKKNKRWFWKTEIHRNNTQEKIELEEKVPASNGGEKKQNNKN